MAENGMLKKFEKMHRIFDVCAEMKRQQLNARRLSLSDVMTCFIILFTGLVTSTIVIVLEHLLRHYSNIFEFFHNSRLIR